MMDRVGYLTGYLLKDFSRSLRVVVPPGLLLALYRVLFQYGGDVPYFAAMGGVMLGFILVVTTLLLSGAANRASTYTLLARLPRRSELLSASALATGAIMLLLAILFVAFVVAGGQVPLTPADLLRIAVRWFALFFFLFAFALHLGRLVARRGSNLAAYLVLILCLVSYQRAEYPTLPVLDRLEAAATFILRPVLATIGGGPDIATLPLYAAAVLITMLYGLILYLLAAWLFERKDLTWAE